MLFKKALLHKVLDGTKVQTRRIHKRTLKPGRTYGIRTSRYEKARAHITILRATQQRLGDITLNEAQAEGFSSIQEFKQAWVAINGAWNPEQTVTAYEFHKTEKQEQQKGDEAKA